jgi:molybdopterin synthase sulfur carrier subunit
MLLENGHIRSYFKITLNGHDIALVNGLDTPVDDQDQVAIFPPIAGG